MFKPRSVLTNKKNSKESSFGNSELKIAPDKTFFETSGLEKEKLINFDDISSKDSSREIEVLSVGTKTTKEVGFNETNIESIKLNPSNTSSDSLNIVKELSSDVNLDPGLAIQIGNSIVLNVSKLNKYL